MYLDTWDDAFVTRVIDGDSLDIKVEIDTVFGSDTIYRPRGRIARVDCFKSTTEAGKLSTAATTEFVTNRLVKAQFIEPYKYMPKSRKGLPKIGGEYMVEIWYNGINLSDWLVDQGHATYWDGVGTGYGLSRLA